MRKLHWSLLKRLYRLGPRFAVYRRLGKRWLLDNRNWVDQQVIIRRPYEVAQLARCQELVSQNRITHFFDIGANFGLYSVLLAGVPHLESILAFEPLPRNADQLAANLYLNGLDELVTVHRIALSDQDTWMDLFVDAGSTGVSTLDPGRLERDSSVYDARVRVMTRTLDGMSDLEGARVLLKIDVEGAELAVLNGMRAFLSANQVWMQIETMPGTRSEVARFMNEAGYRVFGETGADIYFSRIE